MKLLVVDDEAPARRRLIRLLEALPPALVGDDLMIHEADDGDSAIAMISRCAPVLIFLDIEMPGLDGLALAARYADLPPFIFVTAHDAHAVRAFEVGATDYLLKPVSAERLLTAVTRAMKQTLANHRALVERFAALDISRSTRIVTHLGASMSVFDAKDVTRFWSSQKYTVFMANGAEQLTLEPLSALEARLHDVGFVRVHRAELIRASAVTQLLTDEQGGVAVLSDSQRVRVSRRELPRLKKAIAS